jgi:hypothetical protein
MTISTFASKINVASNQSTESDYTSCKYKSVQPTVSHLELLVMGIADERRRGTAKESEPSVKRTSELLWTYRITGIVFR